MDSAEELSFVSVYTQNAKPRKPKGSNYIRKFILQGSSTKTLVSDQFPIQGDWDVFAGYATKVVGFSEDQSLIHKGRWPTLEKTIKGLETLAPRFFDDEVENLQT
jgi:hypothetical protein